MSAVAYERIRRLTVDEVMRMVEAGILGEDEPLELLEGVLVEMSPQGPRHAGTIGVIAAALRQAYGTDRHVREEKPLEVDAHSLPEPDVAVIRGAPRAFVARHPRADETLLVVEVAVSSRYADRRKAAVYAAGGVPVYWLVDLEANRLVVHRSPGADGYGRIEILGPDEEVELPGGAGITKARDWLGAS